jgi:hypothetical protein
MDYRIPADAETAFFVFAPQSRMGYPRTHGVSVARENKSLSDTLFFYVSQTGHPDESADAFAVFFRVWRAQGCPKCPKCPDAGRSESDALI